jgi:transposase
MKPADRVIDVNFAELEALLERARQGPLGEEDYRKLEAAIHTLAYLIDMIGEKETTISRLRALLVKPSTEKTRKVLEQAGLPTPPPRTSPPPSESEKDSQKKKPGHGRNGAEAYAGCAPD